MKFLISHNGGKFRFILCWGSSIKQNLKMTALIHERKSWKKPFWPFSRTFLYRKFSHFFQPEKSPERFHENFQDFHDLRKVFSIFREKQAERKWKSWKSWKFFFSEVSGVHKESAESFAKCSVERKSWNLRNLRKYSKIVLKVLKVPKVPKDLY